MPARFIVRAMADAQALPRMLNLFTQRDVMPSRVLATAADNVLDVEIDIEKMETGVQDLIAEKMRQMVLVIDVQCATHTNELGGLTHGGGLN